MGRLHKAWSKRSCHSHQSSLQHDLCHRVRELYDCFTLSAAKTADKVRCCSAASPTTTTRPERRRRRWSRVLIQECNFKVWWNQNEPLTCRGGLIVLSCQLYVGSTTHSAKTLYISSITECGNLKMKAWLNPIKWIINGLMLSHAKTDTSTPPACHSRQTEIKDDGNRRGGVYGYVGLRFISLSHMVMAGFPPPSTFPCKTCHHKERLMISDATRKMFQLRLTETRLAW